MVRRSLPKIDRSISIDNNITELTEMQPPWSAEEFFGRPGELEIEIGCGKGLFLLNQAQQNPNRLFLGVELSKKYGKFAAYRMARAGVDNAQVIRGDAMKFMAEFATDQSVAAVHIYFPDPWWKERHRRRRIVNAKVVQDVQRVLKPGGILHFWTDVEEYFETGCQTITTHSDLTGPLEVPEKAPEHDMDYRTHFERRMRLNDHPVFRSQFVLSTDS